MEFLERLKEKLEDIFYYPVLHFYQRRTRGFDDTDMYDLSYTMAKFILPRLKLHREVTITCPFGKDINEIMSENTKETEDWYECLDKMIFAFQYIVDDADTMKWCDVYNSEGGHEKIEEAEKKMQEGLELFGKYFTSIWD